MFILSQLVYILTRETNGEYKVYVSKCKIINALFITHGFSFSHCPKTWFMLFLTSLNYQLALEPYFHDKYLVFLMATITVIYNIFEALPMYTCQF